MNLEKKIMLRKKRITVILYRGLMASTVAVMVASIILFSLHEDNKIEDVFNQVLLCAAAMICLSIPVLFEKKLKVFIPNYILILLYIFTFAHFVLGEIYRVYDHSVIFDKALHMVSGVIYAMLSYSIVSILNELPKSKTKLSPFFVSLFAFCFTMTTEYMWELFEHLMDILFNFNMQRWQDSLFDKTVIPDAGSRGEFIHTDPMGNGLRDTMTDMFVNIFGALGVSIYGYIGMKLKPEKWMFNKVILTEGNISALKETVPEIEVNMTRSTKRKNKDIPLKRVRKIREDYLIVAQKAKTVHLKQKEETRTILLENKKKSTEKKTTKK